MGGEEALDMFYVEIEERIMLLISDEEDEVRKPEMEQPPLRSVSRNPVANFPQDSFLIGAKNWNSEFMAEKQREIQNDAGKGRRAAPARRGTGVFIPRCTAYRC